MRLGDCRARRLDGDLAANQLAHLECRLCYIKSCLIRSSGYIVIAPFFVTGVDPASVYFASSIIRIVSRSTSSATVLRAAAPGKSARRAVGRIMPILVFPPS